MKIGLYFGSFNPIHVGHLIIANFMATNSDLEAVWLIVSPHNPHKPKKTLADDYSRLQLVRLAIEGNPKLRASDIEFELPQPSFTIDTLTHLSEQHPEHEFVLIMGGDNLATLPRWKNAELLLKNHEIYVYKRPDYKLGPLETHAQVRHFEAPLMQISSSYIRRKIAAGKSIRYLVPDAVLEEIELMGLYR